jgi:RNA polymerase-binding transcription factor DksA
MLTMHNSTLQRLERLLERHVSELRERKDTLRNVLADEAAGFGPESEWGFACDARGIGAALVAISAATVQSIETALRRLRVGTYGQCLDCDLPISPARLSALPFAEVCVECQSRRDEVTGRGAIPALA